MSDQTFIFLQCLSAFIFCSGITVVLIKKNAVFVLIGIELILNAANLNLIVFSATDPALGGQMLAVFTVVLAAGEVSIALAILINIYRHYQTTDLDQINELKN